MAMLTPFRLARGTLGAGARLRTPAARFGQPARPFSAKNAKQAARVCGSNCGCYDYCVRSNTEYAPPSDPPDPVHPAVLLVGAVVVVAVNVCELARRGRKEERLKKWRYVGPWDTAGDGAPAAPAGWKTDGGCVPGVREGPCSI